MEQLSIKTFINMNNFRDSRGRFVKNHPGFKRKGFKKKISLEERDYIAQLLEKLDEKIIESVKYMNPKDRVNFYLKLTGFLLPKLRRVDYHQKVTAEKVKPTFSFELKNDK